jgi:hypothetical protein
MGYSNKDWLHQQKPHKACAWIWVLNNWDGIITTWAGVDGIQHRMILTWARMFNTQIRKVRWKIGLIPTGKMYAQEDVMDDTIIEEGFQDIINQDNHFHLYPLFHGNVYN